MGGITLATFVKNEANCIEHMIKSVCHFVDEIVIVDTGSTDSTIDICKKYNARIYEVGFTDFGKIRTLTSHLAKEEWVLMLDADETLDGAEELANILDCHDDKEAIALPRKRWADLQKTKQIELDAYPDWQVRLFRNNTKYIWKRELHEFFHGAAIHHLDNNTSSLAINHFHDIFKSQERLIERGALYSKLAKKACVTKEGGYEICKT